MIEINLTEMVSQKSGDSRLGYRRCPEDLGIHYKGQLRINLFN